MVVIPVQDLTGVDFKPAGTLTQGSIRFRRPTDKFGDRQDIIFGPQDESAFAQLQHMIENDRASGIQAQRPAAAAVQQAPPGQGPGPVAADGAAPVSDEKFRTKYKIPADALLARALGAGYVAFDGHFVTIQHIGLGRLTIGKGVKRVPITAISSVQIKPSGIVMSGFIQFSIAGGNEKVSAFGHQTMSAVKDENSVTFGMGEDAAFIAIRDAVEAAQRALHRPQAALAPQQAPAPDDVFAQLEKLGRLRDAGFVTDAEFEAKKAEMLGRM
ncbi:DUF4429 domain-containing protein [Arthrobacter sp. N1]|uniref:DUF4429 domain-containing protein n=1 Tax=Arthrobacter sp. N1 TaxID=619291 RepID=UPI003BB1D9DA